MSRMCAIPMVTSSVPSPRIRCNGWPLDGADPRTSRIYALAEKLGRMIGDTGRDLVSGAGVLVGPATVSGFMDALRTGGGWDIDRRLIARPFPQPLPGKAADRDQWRALRAELARHAGIVMFLAGLKSEAGMVPNCGGRRPPRP